MPKKVEIKTAQLPKHIKPKGTLNKYYKALQSKHRLRFLGSGAFAKVFGNDQYVIKVAVGDGAYDEYLRYALAHQDNPYVPKIFDVKRFKGVKYEKRDVFGEDVTVVVMERLYLTPEGTDEDMFDAISNGSSREEHVTSFERIVNPYGAKKKTADKHLIEMQHIIRALPKHGRFLDVGGSNYMFRGEQLVVTDPVAE